ncbi:hypothetical protein KUCAC02_012016 [Chaenocephalus aceratus]|uniref:Uncharacterized protein n=1 Tax=Chaenocephalus aceratus TaxID=36190 RepID=A0ACB9XAY5_CHAAC|nr:hypothetical protein KUCAC02_012016 [Chaenocephalus aceratus]
MPSVSKSQPLVNTISDNYEILNVLGMGTFGQVLKCLKLDTAEIVAVKVLRNSNADELNMREMSMLKKLRCFDSDKSNIVRCHECFQRMDRTFMVFEMLDMSLHDYMNKRKWRPAPLNGIRTVIKDLATAFDTLKSIGLIHTDLKLDNVMLVDHQVQPLRVKLIDFGLVVKTSEVWKGLVVQPLWHRAPDVILGLPFNAAIDVWSLGTILAVLLLGVQLFPGNNQYDVLRFIIDLLGEPPRKLLNSGLFTESFFKDKSRFCGRTVWKFKTPLEFQLETKLKTSDDREYTFSSLEELKTVSSQEVSKSCQLGSSRFRPMRGPVLVEEATKESSVIRTQTVQGDTPSSVKAEIAHEIKLESITDEDWEISIVSVIGKGHSEAPKSSSEETLPAPVVSEPRKKKKKGIRGFFSRMRRDFFSCFCVPGQGEE